MVDKVGQRWGNRIPEMKERVNRVRIPPVLLRWGCALVLNDHHDLLVEIIEDQTVS